MEFVKIRKSEERKKKERQENPANTPEITYYSVFVSRKEAKDISETLC